MTLLYPKADTHWIALSDRMPDPDEHWRVLVYTEGYDFGGEQVFDVESEKLNENWYIDPSDQPEVCRVASHWAPYPTLPMSERKP